MNKVCQCSGEQGLFVPHRQLSFIVALLLLLAFSFFMAGYFLGKKNVIVQYSEKVQQEAVADHIYTTMLSSAQDHTHDSNTIPMSYVTDSSLSIEPITSPSFADALEEVPEKIQEQHYYAQLIGFGTEKAAQLFVKRLEAKGFVNKLAAKGIEPEIKKHVSKTVKGHTSYWYQVVTTPYANKNDLSVIVDEIIKAENIKGACIRNC